MSDSWTLQGPRDAVDSIALILTSYLDFVAFIESIAIVNKSVISVHRRYTNVHQLFISDLVRLLSSLSPKKFKGLKFKTYLFYYLLLLMTYFEPKASAKPAGPISFLQISTKSEFFARIHECTKSYF